MEVRGCGYAWDSAAQWRVASISSREIFHHAEDFRAGVVQRLSGGVEFVVVVPAEVLHHHRGVDAAGHRRRRTAGRGSASWQADRDRPARRRNDAAANSKFRPNDSARRRAVRTRRTARGPAESPIARRSTRSALLPAASGPRIIHTANDFLINEIFHDADTLAAALFNACCVALNSSSSCWRRFFTITTASMRPARTPTYCAGRGSASWPADRNRSARRRNDAAANSQVSAMRFGASAGSSDAVNGSRTGRITSRSATDSMSTSSSGRRPARTSSQPYCGNSPKRRASCGWLQSASTKTTFTPCAASRRAVAKRSEVAPSPERQPPRANIFLPRALAAIKISIMRSNSALAPFSSRPQTFGQAK